MTTTTATLSIEEANDFLDTLKFWPFGTSHEGRFVIEEDDPEHLHLRRLGYDSSSWNFGDEFEDDADLYDKNTDLDNLHTQDFTLTLNPGDLDTVDDLLGRVAYLTAYAMAHEGLEWLRHADGSYVHDPHQDGGDVVVSIERNRS